MNCLIIDDLLARNFVIRHFPKLKKRLVGTIGFVRNCCFKESISVIYAIKILNSMKYAVEKGEKERPCSIDKKNYQKILIPVIKEIKRCFNGK